MKSDKMLKYTGIIQGVLIGILLLIAIAIEVTGHMNLLYRLQFVKLQPDILDNSR